MTHYCDIDMHSSDRLELHLFNTNTIIHESESVSTKGAENLYLSIPGDRSEAIITMTKKPKIIYVKLF
jgi:hypothetical protein